MVYKSLVERLLECERIKALDAVILCEVFGVSNLRSLAGHLACKIIEDYLPRPRFEDGAVVKVGDKFTVDDGSYTVESYHVSNSGYYSLSHAGIWNCTAFYADNEQVRRYEPDIVDAYGMPIKIGDTVMVYQKVDWQSGEKFDDSKYIVTRYEQLKPVLICECEQIGNKDCVSYFKANELIHFSRDTQESIDTDATLPPKVYCKRVLKWDKKKLNTADDEYMTTAMCKNLIKRQQIQDRKA